MTVARVWRGWTATAADADEYERVLRTEVRSELAAIDGFRDMYVLRRDTGGTGDEVEFLVLNLFDSLESVRAFAGPDHETAVISAPARRVLSRAEPRARHYEVRGG